MAKRFESKDRESPAGTRTGPRARAAQDRKFGDARSRGSNRGDPYQRADRPPRPRPDRDAPYGERLLAPARGAGITLDPDVARVFRDSDAVNEALRLVIRLARSVGGGPRPAFSSDQRRSSAPSRPRSGGAPSRPRSGAPAERYARDEPAPAGSRRGRPEPKFEDAE